MSCSRSRWLVPRLQLKSYGSTSSFSFRSLLQGVSLQFQRRHYFLTALFVRGMAKRSRFVDYFARRLLCLGEFSRRDFCGGRVCELP